jgi:hypothetical protein
LLRERILGVVLVKGKSIAKVAIVALVLGLASSVATAKTVNSLGASSFSNLKDWNGWGRYFAAPVKKRFAQRRRDFVKPVQVAVTPTPQPVTAPLPASALLMVGGLLALGALRRKG